MMQAQERGRWGFSLVEIVVAVALAAGPLLLAFHLVQSNTRAAQFDHDRATARMILLDLATLVQGEGLEGARQRMVGDKLSDLLSDRITRMPDAAREPYFEQARNVLGHIRGRLEQDVDPSKPGLARLVLSTELPGRANVQVVALFRPGAVERLWVDENRSCQATQGVRVAR